MSTPGHDRRVVIVVAVAAVALAVLSTIGIAAAAGAFGSNDAGGRCPAPSLPGHVVDVALMNMGGSMMGGQMPRMGGTMHIATSTSRVPAGPVSFRVTNLGTLVHELVVLPLGNGAAIGARVVGPDDRVDETGSLGEASTTCGIGAGDGIAPGATSWITLDLPSGDYERVCNLTGHYAAGMYAGLHVEPVA